MSRIYFEQQININVLIKKNIEVSLSLLSAFCILHLNL